jgi:hypothetical protein
MTDKETGTHGTCPQCATSRYMVAGKCANCGWEQVTLAGSSGSYLPVEYHGDD